MFFKIPVLFSIFQVIFVAHVLAAKIHDDIALENTQQRLDLLQTTNENLHLKIDSLEMTLNQQLTIQRDDFKKALNELKAALTSTNQKGSIKSVDSEEANDQENCKYLSGNLNDIRGELNQQWKMQRDELKKDWEEIKVALTTQIESIKSMGSGELRKELEEMKAAFAIQKESIKSVDSEKANLNGIRSELSQQLTLQTSKLEKVLEELKAAQKESIMSIDPGKANLNDIHSETEKQNICQCENITNPTTTTQSLPTNCAQALKKSFHNGIYKIKLPAPGLEPFNVYCLKDTANTSESHIHDTDSANSTSAWLVIQRRQNGTINFYRNWTEYQHGFGNLEGEFFMGLDKIHALTNLTLHELLIQMEDYKGIKLWAKYSSFAIGSENEFYALNKLGAYTGDASDSLRIHEGMKWSTFDRDNDDISNVNCAQWRSGAWWYKSCYMSNLNGQYFNGKHARDLSKKGINWFTEDGSYYTLKYVQMAIRPVQ